METPKQNEIMEELRDVYQLLGMARCLFERITKEVMIVKDDGASQRVTVEQIKEWLENVQEL